MADGRRQMTRWASGESVKSGGGDIGSVQRKSAADAEPLVCWWRFAGCYGVCTVMYNAIGDMGRKNSLLHGLSSLYLVMFRYMLW